MSDELVAFLRARLDEDEAAAKAVDPTHDAFNGTGIIVMHLHGGGTRSVTLNSEMARYLLRSNPARMLREVEAKRKLLDDILPALQWADAMADSEFNDLTDHAGDFLRILAAPYAGRDGFRTEWGD